MKTLNLINKRLIEISSEKPRRIFKLNENRTNSTDDRIEEMNIDDLDIEKMELEFQRQMILDERGNLFNKLLWSVLAPIVVSIITTLLISIYLS